MSDASFGISYAPGLRVLFTVLGLGPAISGIDVTAEDFRVRLGWAFRATVPRRAIFSVEPDDERVTGWGVHGWGGSWLVNGSSSGLVRFRLDPPVQVRAVGFPVQLDMLRVSVEDPEELVRLLSRG